MKAQGAVLASLLVLGSAACPGDPPRERTTEGVGLTIYSAPAPANQQQVWNAATQRWEIPLPGYAIVKEWRKMKLAAGVNVIRFPDVAAKIDATTVLFTSLTDPAGTSVLEQNFEYDLVSADKILQKHIDRPITVELENGGQVSGTLVSFDAAQIVVQSADPPGPLQIVQRQNNVRNISFAALPGGLITRPTLVWQIEAKREGEHLAKVAYQTGGMSWNADYTVVVSPDESALDLAAWVTIRNQSGGSYKDAELKLVAGDVHRVEAPRQMDAQFAAGARNARLEEPGFVEKPFFEYHLYTLGRPTTLPDNSTKQIELFPQATGVPLKKTYLYYGGVGFQPYGRQPYFDRNYGITSNPKVDVYMEFRNGKDQGLGVPLPAGRVRVNKKDPADGSLEFVGEDSIDHTPKDERVRLKLGSAFDIVAERKQADFTMDERAHWLRETFEIRVRNHKDGAVEVIVKENLYRWANWTIEKKSHDFTKEDARTVHFPVSVPKDGEAVVTYTVLYTW